MKKTKMNLVVWTVVYMLQVAVFADNVTDNPLTDSFEYNAEETTWQAARDACVDRDLNLPFLRNASSKAITAIKRRLGFTNVSAIWTGDYQSFSVIVPESHQSRNLTGVLCVAATLANMKINAESNEYNFNLTATDCKQSVMIICKCNLGNNQSSILLPPTKTSQWQSANAVCTSEPSTSGQCSLWSPTLTLYNTVTDGTVSTSTLELRGKEYFFKPRVQYWINALVEKRNASLQDEDVHVFKCGYLKYRKPMVLYGPCNVQRPYICDMCMDNKDIMGSNMTFTFSTERDSQTDDQPTASHIGSYVGIPVAVVFVLVAAVLVVWIWRKRRGQNNDQPVPGMRKDTNSQPHGGRSFKPDSKQRSPDLKESPNVQTHRVTNYLEINPADLEEQKSQMSGSQLNTRPGNSRVNPYASVQLSHISDPTHSKVAPNSTVSYGYLPMDGHVTESSDSIGAETTDDTYDSLCHSIREGDLEESSNVYGMASGIAGEDSEDVNVYSTIDRKASRKALVDYDHVAMSRGSETMNNRECLSEEITHDKQLKGRKALNNPGYARTVDSNA